MKVGPEGGLATSLTTEAEGVPLGFTNDLDVDDQGNVYFTDSSTKYKRSHTPPSLLSSFSPKILHSSLFLHPLELSFKSFRRIASILVSTNSFLSRKGDCGYVSSRNKSFHKLGFVLFKQSRNFLQLIFSSEDSGRVLKYPLKYWLKGEKAGTWEPFAVLLGFPDNVRTNEKGEFWVAIHCRRSIYAHILGEDPKLRHVWLKLPISGKIHYLMHIGGRMHAAVVKYSEDGKVVQILEDRQGKVVRAVSEVDERKGKLWMGSVLMSPVAVYDLE
ncbi:protein STRICTOSIDINE SYNTHASE-LIKE 3-like [Salvia splendens]|uniref:protein STRICTOSIDINE SYNTHASE-LIKE 3-like n=1 Tax=Salvia splendens TaxID=180675 RepID=UPI001C27E98B|nr:protein STRICTOSIDINE SYNTHASE-LIKE 3-like [Salvia splendens]